MQVQKQLVHESKPRLMQASRQDCMARQLALRAASTPSFAPASHSWISLTTATASGWAQDEALHAGTKTAGA